MHLLQKNTNQSLPVHSILDAYGRAISWAPPLTVDFGQAASICALQAPRAFVDHSGSYPHELK